MKKFKRIVVSALAVVILVCMMAIPASATKDFVDSVSDDGDATGIEWDIYLQVSGKSAAGRVNVIKKRSGQIPLSISARLAGEMLKGSIIAPFYDFDNTTSNTLTVYASGSISEDISYAYCEYWANGIYAGLLELPQQ